MSLHVGVTTGAALLLVGVYQNVVNEVLPPGRHHVAVNLTPYLFCIGFGMILSARYIEPLATRLHQLTWADAARLASQQVTVLALLLFAFMFAFKDRGMSRLFLGSYLCLCWVMLLFMNHSLPRFLAQIFFGRARKVPTLFIGSVKNLARLQNWIASKRALGVQPVGFLTEDGRAPGASTPPFLGTLADLSRMIEQKGVTQVIALEMPRGEEAGRSIVETCQAQGCRLLIYCDLSDTLNHPVVAVNEEGHQFFSLQGEPLEDPLNRILKRCLDIAIALPVVLFVLPLLTLWVAVMQRLQAPGPVFFSQKRTGHSQQPFRLLKFRSMYAAGRDAPAEARQAQRGDSRIYPFGQFLRRTSLDEFPQFINVLRGEMSIVGPRPHMVEHDEQFNQSMVGYRTRFYVKPGITGLAQSRGFRGEITEPGLLEKRIELDVFYVAEWSIFLDLEIIARTARQVIFPPKAAY